MPGPNSYRDAHLSAIRAARQAAQQLKLDEVPWIDTFDAVVRAGALLVFQPLKTLFGVYIPKFETGDAPGVMINVKHPLNLQRYTAAHELGHLWMGHTGSFDTEAEILGTLARSGDRAALTEVAAEVFAAHLLMPLNRVLPRINEFGLSPKDLTHPPVAYSLSLWFGVSYRAMVHQLSALRVISKGDAQNLLSTQPKKIKRGLLDGGSIDDWHADVWPLTARESGQLLHARVGDELSIVLPSHAAGGFLWDTSEVDRGAFEVIGIEDLSNEPDHDEATLLVGSAPARRARIRVKDPGEHGLALTERRPWQPQGPPASEFHLRVVGMRQPERGAAEQLRRRMVS